MRPVELTVVIPSVNGLHDLIGCLEAVERMRDGLALEVLVVDRLGPLVRELVRSRFPEVRLLPVPASTTIPEMRHLAFQEARADAVAVIEDHVIVPPEWGRKLLDGLAAGHDVVGGPIANLPISACSLATFLCEYSACLPLPEGAANWLPGNNIVYRRALLERFREVTAEGKWENRLHDAMRAEGITLYCDASLIVGHKKHFGFVEYISQRYLYSRSYAGARSGAGPPAMGPRRSRCAVVAAADSPGQSRQGRAARIGGHDDALSPGLRQCLGGRRDRWVLVRTGRFTGQGPVALGGTELAHEGSHGDYRSVRRTHPAGPLGPLVPAAAPEPLDQEPLRPRPAAVLGAGTRGGRGVHGRAGVRRLLLRGEFGVCVQRRARL
ncbi:MAG: glycosyltransferase [Gemmatimonadetes bacterium]|nr:glycosyltransferase [Gemmatimonadota bacterium]